MAWWCASEDYAAVAAEARDATHAPRFDPSGTEMIRGGGAGKYFHLDTDGASVAPIRVRDGPWEVEHTAGAASFEPWR